MPSSSELELRAQRRGHLEKMFREVKIDAPRSDDIDETSICKIADYLVGGETLPFHMVGVIRRSHATPQQLLQLLQLVELHLSSGHDVVAAAKAALREVCPSLPRIRFANGSVVSLREIGFGSIANAFAQARESLESYFANSPVGVLELGTAILRDSGPAAMYMAVCEAGTYHWYLKSVLSCESAALREFEAGVADGLLSVGSGATTGPTPERTRQHLMNTLQVFSHANGMSSEAASSPTTDLLLKYWLVAYAKDDPRDCDARSKELSSAKAILPVHLIESDHLAVHTVLSSVLRPELVHT